MGKSKIEWTEATWNPVTGCTKVSVGCKNCYAERITTRWGQKFTDIKLHENRIDKPLSWKKPRRVFVNSMSDLFHEKVPDYFIDAVFVVMVQATKHTFQILTKRPGRMMDYMLENYPSPPPNVWLGTSVENQDTVDLRMPILVQTPAAVRFVSFEPLLEHIDPCLDIHKRQGTLIDWAIVGGESGPSCRPFDADWARAILKQCKAAEVPFFMKQLGGWPNKRSDMKDLPKDLRIREFPKICVDTNTKLRLF